MMLQSTSSLVKSEMPFQTKRHVTNNLNLEGLISSKDYASEENLKMLNLLINRTDCLAPPQLIQQVGYIQVNLPIR